MDRINLWLIVVEVLFIDVISYKLFLRYCCFFFVFVFDGDKSRCRLLRCGNAIKLMGRLLVIPT